MMIDIQGITKTGIHRACFIRRCLIHEITTEVYRDDMRNIDSRKVGVFSAALGALVDDIWPFPVKAETVRINASPPLQPEQPERIRKHSEDQRLYWRQKQNESRSRRREEITTTPQLSD